MCVIFGKYAIRTCVFSESVSPEFLLDELEPQPTKIAVKAIAPRQAAIFFIDYRIGFLFFVIFCLINDDLPFDFKIILPPF